MYLNDPTIHLFFKQTKLLTNRVDLSEDTVVNSYMTTLTWRSPNLPLIPDRLFSVSQSIGMSLQTPLGYSIHPRHEQVSYCHSLPSR